MIDRYLLRYFLAVIDAGNFTAAAAQCNVSQPTLSVGIAKLERLLGRALFLRTNRRVELTDPGTQFAVHARRIESEFNLVERSLRAARPVFRLGILNTIPSSWFSALAIRLSAVAAAEQVELTEGRERELLERLDRGRLDAAITIIRSGSGRLVGEILLTEGYALAVPASHPLADEPLIEAQALAGDAMIVRRQCEVLSETSRHFTSRGIRPFFTARTTNDDRVLLMVQAGMGVTVMPDGFQTAGVARPKLAGFEFVRDLGILHGAHIDRPLTSDQMTLAVIRSVFQCLVGDPTGRVVGDGIARGWPSAIF